VLDNMISIAHCYNKHMSIMSSKRCRTRLCWYEA
jgi:hypothetical protein